MKRKTKIIAILAILILGITHTAYCNSEFKEQIDIFVTSPDNGIFTINVNIGFDSLQIPMNVSAFDSHLINAEYYTRRYNESLYVTNLILRYSQGFDSNNPNQVVREFLRIFSHESLNLLEETGAVIDNNTKTTKFRYQFGYIQYNQQTAKDFLKYMPREDFGNYVDKFLDLYIPGNDSTVVVEYYMLSKTSTGLNWKLWITGSSSGVFSPGETAINLNQLLNNSGGSLSSGEYNASITVRLENQTYSTIYIKSVTPTPDYDDFQDGEKRFIWELHLNSELQNVVVNVNLSNASDAGQRFPAETCILVLAVMLATATVIIIAVYRQHKKQEQSAQGNRHRSPNSRVNGEKTSKNSPFQPQSG
jgi:hypothetical protein